jgi:hypothetical protein
MPADTVSFELIPYSFGILSLAGQEGDLVGRVKMRR